MDAVVDKKINEAGEDVNKAIKHLEDGKARFRIVLKAQKSINLNLFISSLEPLRC